MKVCVVRSGVLGFVAAAMLSACAASDAERGFPSAGTGAAAGGGAGDMGAAGQLAPQAGNDAQGGSGGDAPAGTGGAGGSGGTASAGRGSAGVGGAGGASGSGGTGAQGGSGGSAAGSGGGGSGGDMGGGEGGCPTQYTVATHIVMNVSWSGSLAINSGSGKVHLWTKSKFDGNGDTATIESMSCGTILPEIKTSALAGSTKILPEIPNASWDNAAMPKFAGTATTSGSTMTINSGTALVGLTLSDPNGAWPAATAITGVDHDGDGKPGVTAIPRDGDGYSPPPTSLAQTKRADKLYLAIRNVTTLTAPADGCPETYTGTANVSKFENHVIGCHVKGGGECTASEAKFVDDNRTIFTVNSATYTTKVISDTATCADARAALPVE